ncbi:MAG: oligosaccharide flippase family protein [candidate division WOR-3 bacterium]
MLKGEGFIKGSIWNFLGTATEKILNYILNIAIIRLFGKEIYGIFSLTTGIFRILTRFGLSGIEAGSSYFIPQFISEKKEENVNSFLKFVLFYFIFIGIIFSLLLITLSDFLEKIIFRKNYLSLFIFGFSLGFPFSLLTLAGAWTIRAFSIMKVYVLIVQFLRPFLNLIFLFILVYSLKNFLSVPLSYSISFIITGIIIIIFYQLKFKGIKKSIIRKNIVISFFSFTIPIMVMELVRESSHWVDVIMLGLLKSSQEVGLYNAALRTSEFILLIIWIFSPIFNPVCSRDIREKNFESLKKNFHKTLIFSLILSFPFIHTFLLKGSEILNFMFGKDFKEMAVVLNIVGCSNLLVSLQSPFVAIIIMSYEQKKWANLNIIALIINIFLNFFLIKKYGVLGASISTSFSIIFLTFSAFFIFKSKKYFQLDWNLILEFILWQMIILIALNYLSKIQKNSLISIFLIFTLGFLLSLLFIFSPKFYKKYLK